MDIYEFCEDFLCPHFRDRFDALHRTYVLSPGLYLKIQMNDDYYNQETEVVIILETVRGFEVKWWGDAGVHAMDAIRELINDYPEPRTLEYLLLEDADLVLTGLEEISHLYMEVS